MHSQAMQGHGATQPFPMASWLSAAITHTAPPRARLPSDYSDQHPTSRHKPTLDSKTATNAGADPHFCRVGSDTRPNGSRENCPFVDNGSEARRIGGQCGEGTPTIRQPPSPPIHPKHAHTGAGKELADPPRPEGKPSVDARPVAPNSFKVDKHFYPRVVGASIHPMVATFMRLGNEKIAARYCFPPDHQVLTDRGFVYVDRIRDGDVVAAYDQHSKHLIYQRCQAVSNPPSPQTLIHVKSGHDVHMTTTADHRWFANLSHPNSSGCGDAPSFYGKLQAADLHSYLLSHPSHEAHILVAAANGIEGTVAGLPFAKHFGLQSLPQVRALLKLHGYVLGSGLLRSCADAASIAAKTQEQARRLRALLTDLGLVDEADFHQSLRPDGSAAFEVMHPQWADHFSAAVRHLGGNGEDGAWFRQLDAQSLRVIIQGLSLAGGAAAPTGGLSFGATSIGQRDVMIELLLLAGYSAHFEPIGSEPCAEWKILATTQEGYTLRHGESAAAPYAGPTYCVAVPTGLIVVRQVLAVAADEQGCEVVTRASRPVIIGNCQLNPKADHAFLLGLLQAIPSRFCWAGADLFKVATPAGNRHMIVIETNSCPSGQKSFPQASLCAKFSSTEHDGGYHILMRDSFLALLKRQEDALREEYGDEADRHLPKGDLAVVYDKNLMEVSGYAAALADVSNERVWLVELSEYDRDPPVRYVSGFMEVRDAYNQWHPIRGAFRYVTQKPWTRIPVNCRTFILNPVSACLAGGRNKGMADKAYEGFNMEVAASGLAIRTPLTVRSVGKAEIPFWVGSMGGRAVLKVPTSNAGQGVFTITSPSELAHFMDIPHQHHDRFVVQALIGSASWSSTTPSGKYFQTGTIPDEEGHTYVADLRMMIGGTMQGWQPVALYSRRAHKPLVEHLTPEDSSWDILGTNLSVKNADGTFNTEPERLLMMDTNDFTNLGLGIDDLIDAYVQTVLAATAIDRLAKRLQPTDGNFDFELFQAMDADDPLLAEVFDRRVELGGTDPVSACIAANASDMLR